MFKLIFWLHFSRTQFRIQMIQAKHAEINQTTWQVSVQFTFLIGKWLRSHTLRLFFTQVAWSICDSLEVVQRIIQNYKWLVLSYMSCMWRTCWSPQFLTLEKANIFIIKWPADPATALGHQSIIDCHLLPVYSYIKKKL